MTQEKMPLLMKTIILLPTVVDRTWVEAQAHLLSAEPLKPLVLDFKDVTRCQTAGIAFIALLNRKMALAQSILTLDNIPQKLLDRLTTWQGAYPATTGTNKSLLSKENFLERVGGMLESWWHVVLDSGSMLCEMIYWGTLGYFKKRDIRKGATIDQMYHLGYSAIGIVMLLSFLIGVVLALQTAMQLRVFGAGIFLAPMMSIFMTRELGPLLTAIILAGRTGSATTAEIATMAVAEEIDALRVMGINPIQFVTVPKFWAITITMPMLSILATAIGIFGGLLVAVTYLGLEISLYAGQMFKNIFIHDVIIGFVKSITFAWIIIWIGSYFGFITRGGAEEVGRNTTKSVVTAIFAIILADAFFSFIF